MRFFCFRTVPAGGRGAGVLDKQIAEIADAPVSRRRRVDGQLELRRAVPRRRRRRRARARPGADRSQEAWDTWGRFGARRREGRHPGAAPHA